MNVPALAPGDDGAAGSVRKALIVLALLAVSVSAIAWLVSGFDTSSRKRATSAAEPVPTAAVTACGVTLSDVPGVIPDAPGAMVPVASVTFDNPTSTDVLARALVDFSGVGLREVRDVRVAARSKVMVELRPNLGARPEGYECTLANAAFAPA